MTSTKIAAIVPNVYIPRLQFLFFSLIAFLFISFSGDSAISDMFGLGLPRGSLMGSQSSAVGSPSYRNYQYYGQAQGSSTQQYEVKSHAQTKLELPRAKFVRNKEEFHRVN